MKKNYSTLQLSTLVVLRLAIGWHLLYEGLIKIFDPSWSAIGYLLDSKGFLAEFFYWIASDHDILKAVEFMNAWGLTAVGIGLILGILTKHATLGGILLLTFYYISHPPFIGFEYALPTEGNYLWVDKTLIEMIALLVLFVFPTGDVIGLDRFLRKK